MELLSNADPTLSSIHFRYRDDSFQAPSRNLSSRTKERNYLTITSLQETSIHFQIEMRNDESKTTISSPIQPGHPVHPNGENFSSLSLIAAGSTGVIEIFFSAETKRNFCAT